MKNLDTILAVSLIGAAVTYGIVVIIILFCNKLDKSTLKYRIFSKLELVIRCIMILLTISAAVLSLLNVI